MRAIIEVDIPDYQVGQEVSIYFKDTMMIKGVVQEPIERGTDLVSVGRLETKDAYLLNILKEQGFYLLYTKKETKFGDCEYYQVLYPKED